MEILVWALGSAELKGWGRCSLWGDANSDSLVMVRRGFFAKMCYCGLFA